LGEEIELSQAGDRAPSATARWIAAVLCIVYGFAKINGSQFTVLDSELTKPLGEVSGFWLTWYYFGYSPAYGTLLALVQIVGGILLIIPRTALAGVLVLLPVACNILLIDLFYGVDPGGTLAAVVLLVCLCIAAAPYVDRLRAAVLLNTLPARPATGSLAALVVVVVASFALTWWVANYNNRAPTEIDGVWEVVSQTDGATPGRRWQQVFFEYNRAGMVVFRSAQGPDQRHHFEIDSTKTVRIWSQWLKKGELIMVGQLTSRNEIQLDLKQQGRGGRLILRRSPAH
jgi:hypothetical protein